MFESIKRWFRGEQESEKERAAGGEPVATPPPGAASAGQDPDRETSTNAQMEGAVGQPWPDDS
jgi:hypothetical protein